MSPRPPTVPTDSSDSTSATTTSTSTASIASASSDTAKSPVSTIKEWHTQDDLENDLWAYSEISLNKDDLEVPTPPSILEWNAQREADRNSSIFDTPHQIDDDITFVFSGRGRGGVSKLYRPGEPVESDLMEEKFIERKLREVSGLGYSNEYIESIVKAYQKDFHDFADAETGFTEPHFPDSSRSISNHIFPRPKGNRGKNRPAANPVLEYHLPYPSGQRVEVKEAEVEKHPVTPPPLSVILGRHRPKTPGKNSAVPVEEHSEAAVTVSPPATHTNDDSATLSSSTADDSSASNEFWWTNAQNSGSNTDTDASDEPLSWRRAPRDSNVAFNAGHWRRDFRRRDKLYDIKSTSDFPPLGWS